MGKGEDAAGASALPYRERERESFRLHCESEPKTNSVEKSRLGGGPGVRGGEGGG